MMFEKGKFLGKNRFLYVRKFYRLEILVGMLKSIQDWY